MLRNLLFFAVFVPGLYAAFRSRFAALLLYFWYAFFRPQDWIWLDVSSLQLSMLLGILLVVPSLLSGILPNLTHPLSIGAVLFFVSALVGQMGAIDPATGWYWIDYLARLLIITLLATSLVTDRKKFLLAVMVIALSFGFHATKAGLRSVITGGERYFEGPGGAYSDNNAYGIAMAMIIPFLICVAQNTTSKLMRQGCLLALPLVIIGAIGTYSRSAFLALAAVGLTLVLFQRRRMLWLGMALAIAIPIGVFMANQEGYLDRMSTIQTYSDEVSAASRPHFWRVAVEMVRDRPFGIGLFNYEAAYDRYDFLRGQYGVRRSVHSSHFQVLAENGFLGVAAWVFLWVYAFIAVFRIRRRGYAADNPEDRQTYITGSIALLTSMVAFLVGGSFIAMSLNDLTWVTFGLVAALDRISSGACQPETAAGAVPASVSPAGGFPAPLAGRS